jgi:hypothetical protein
MGNTANNNWPYPESTDLVKDGATAIENLADAIDTTLGVYSPATPGLVKLQTVTFSGVASQSVNNVFSSTYKSYKIVGYIESSTTDANNLRFRLRVSNTDLSSGIYRTITNLGDTSADNFVVLERSNTATSWLIARYGGRGGSFEHLISNPQLTDYTHLTGTSSVADETNARNLLSAGMVNDELSYTGFTILTSAQNMTGRISVYGFSE